MKRFFRTSVSVPSPAASAQKRHLLDLSRQHGSLERLFLDLPPVIQDDHHYLRQKTHMKVPVSYRSGLAFFGMIMLLTMFGLTALEAQTRADSHRSLLHRQLVESFSELAMDLEAYQMAPHDPQEVGLAPAPSLEAFSDPLEQQAQLVRMSLQVREGYQDFQAFVDDWKKSGNLLEKLRWMQVSAQRSLNTWDQVFHELESFPLYELGPAQRETFYQSLVTMSDLRNFLRSFVDFYDPLLTILGKGSPQRILVFLQDDHERRSTGGALSAGMELLLENGEFISKKPFHVADYDDQSVMKLPPPPELSELSERWNLSTANAFLNVPQSLEKISWFWQREARSSPDLILVINTSVFDRLQETGALPSLPANIALHWSALRLKGDREALKNFTQHLLTSFVQSVSEPEAFFQIWPLLAEFRAQKQLMALSTEKTVRSFLDSRGLSGSLPPASNHEDYLLVSRVNKNANASDRWIYEKLRLHTSISDAGVIRNWLQIERKHRWESAFLSPLLGKIGTPVSASVRNLLSTGPQRNMSRVLVPKGSRLQSVVGLSLADISVQETETHTIWSFSQELSPGELKQVELTYELPWTFDTSSVDNYRLKLVKQPGTPTTDFEHVFKLPTHLSAFQQLPEEPLTSLSKDERVAVVAGRNP